MNQRMAAIALRPHVRGAECNFPLTEIIQDLLPGLPVIFRQENTVAVIFDDRRSNHKPRRLTGCTDSGKAVVQRLSRPEVLLPDPGDCPGAARGDLRHRTDPAVCADGIPGDPSVDGITGVAAVAILQHIGSPAGGSKRHIQIAVIHTESLRHQAVQPAVLHPAAFRFFQGSKRPAAIGRVIEAVSPHSGFLCRRHTGRTHKQRMADPAGKRQIFFRKPGAFFPMGAAVFAGPESFLLAGKPEPVRFHTVHNQPFSSSPSIQVSVNHHRNTLIAERLPVILRHCQHAALLPVFSAGDIKPFRPVVVQRH